MSDTYVYTLKMVDASSAPMQKVVGKSAEAIAKLTAMDNKNKAITRSVNDFGRSLTTLHKQIELLRQERDIIHPQNVTTIKEYNRQIEKLTRQANKLETMGTEGGMFKKAFSSLDAATGGLLSNPVVWAGAALGKGVKSAMSFDEGMSKINITAQMDEASLADLRAKLIKISKDNKTDITLAPDGFEKILSQLGDVEQSLPIFDAALKGSKAGFVDLDTTAAALAQTMSILGSERANAQEVLDVFFAAKRVGAGEFADFARYMPNLIAGADNLGIAYKEVAGVYAYMTGKGQSAERAAVLMENMFSVLGRGEVRANLKKIGVDIFDNTGKMRDMVSIFTDFKKVTSSMTDEQRSSLIEALGIVDKEAKNSFSVMLSDTEKLARSISEVSDSAGETAKNLGFARNEQMKAIEVWQQAKTVLFDLGNAVLPIVSAALSAVGVVLDIIGPVLNGVVGIFTWWIDKIGEGNPLIIGLTAYITALTVAVNLATIATKAKATWDAVVTGTTAAWTAATWLLNAALYANPIVWVIGLVAGLVAGIVWAWNKFEGFRKVILGVWEVIKELGKSIISAVLSPIENLIGGLGSLGKALWKLFTGDFKGAWEDAKDGAVKLFKANPIVASVEAGVEVSKVDFSGAYTRGAAKVKNTTEAGKKAAADTAALPAIQRDPAGAATSPTDANALIKSLQKGKKGAGNTGKSNAVNLDQIVPNRKGSTAYGAIASLLRPVRMASLGAAASAAVASASVPAAAQLPRPTAPGQVEMSAASRPKVQMDRFCDNVIINIAHADGQGEDEIRRVVMDAITSIMDDGQTA